MKRRFLVAMLVFYLALVALVIVTPQVLAMRSATPPNPTSCTGALAHATTTGLTVPDGAVCRVSGSTVNGAVAVGRQAYFEASNTKINGTVHATGAITIFLHDQTWVTGSLLVDGASQLFLYRTRVSGRLQVSGSNAPGFGHVQLCDTTAGEIAVTGSGPDVLIGDPPGGCPGNQVTNDLVVVSNDVRTELVVSGNVIGGSLLVSGNVGDSAKHVTNNSVQGRVDLQGNAAPFDSSNNAASAT